MSPLILEGDTLGQRQRHYNKLVEAAAADERFLLSPINYDDPDVDNLLKIDVACRRRDVEYVVGVLQGDDMLYASRAVKRSNWLITDDQYAHIINPKNLYDNVFPNMMPKIQNKFLLTIRHSLKNKARVEEFFKYYSNENKVAQKWLPYCSVSAVEKAFRDYNCTAYEINLKILKRLLENSINIFKLYPFNTYGIDSKLKEIAKILIAKCPDEYFEMIKRDPWDMPPFGIKTTQRLMKNNPEIVFNDFQIFANCIHLPTFTKYLKKEELQSFLMKQMENENMKTWIHHDNIKHFVKYFPVETRFDFIQKVFIQEVNPVSDEDNSDIYRWYHLAPFDVAFVDLKSRISVESSPAQRNQMLSVLIHCARSNPEHVKALLIYYLQEHVNEPVNFKLNFIENISTLAKTHTIDDTAWNIFNQIFSSIKGYLEYQNTEPPNTIKAIIVNNILRDENVPDSITDKCNFLTLNDYCKKVNEIEKQKVFKYLLNIETNKLKKITVSNEDDMSKACDSLTRILGLLKQWDGKLSDYTEIIQEIKRLIKAKRDNSLQNNLCFVFNMDKAWRKDLIEESIFLGQNDDACVYALKHDPGLLHRHSTEVTKMCCNDAIILKHTLQKLRIYWPQSLSTTWTELYLDVLEKPTGHKAAIRGLFTLLSRKQILTLLEKYAPVETTIDWNNIDPIKLSVQKTIASHVNLIRPTIDIEKLLPYSKGDYLQFILPSLYTLLNYLSPAQFVNNIPSIKTLLNVSAFSRQRCFTIAHTKLKPTEMKDFLAHVCNSSKHPSTRKEIFTKAYEFLAKSRNDADAVSNWQLLSTVIDSLTADEKPVILELLERSLDVPMDIRAAFLVKCYSFLESFPEEGHCRVMLRGPFVCSENDQLFHYFEPKFVEQHVLSPVHDLIKTFCGAHSYVDILIHRVILASYLIYSDNEEVQYAKYEKYIDPLLDGCFASWKTTDQGKLFVKSNCSDLFKEIIEKVKPHVLKNRVNFIISNRVFKSIEIKLRTLPVEENYGLITYWTIATLFIESLNDFVQDHSEADFIGTLMETGDSEEIWHKLCYAAAPLFGKSILNFIKQDLVSKWPSLSRYFVESMEKVFGDLSLNKMAQLQTLKHIFDDNLDVTYLIGFLGTKFDTMEDESEVDISKSMEEIHAVLRTHHAVDLKILLN